MNNLKETTLKVENPKDVNWLEIFSDESVNWLLEMSRGCWLNYHNINIV